MIRLTRRPRSATDSVVPMINVAFLLLVFFLMVAVIAPPDPLAVALPEAEAGDAAPDEVVISVGASGELARGEVRGPSALTDVAGRDVTLRADAGLEGVQLARVLAELKANGAERVTLAVSSAPTP